MGWECTGTSKNETKQKKSSLIRSFIVGNFSTKLTRTFLRRSASDSQINQISYFKSYNKLVDLNENLCYASGIKVEERLILSENEVISL